MSDSIVSHVFSIELIRDKILGQLDLENEFPLALFSLLLSGALSRYDVRELFKEYYGSEGFHPNIATYTVDKLKEVANSLGILESWSMKKAEIVDLLAPYKHSMEYIPLPNMKKMIVLMERKRNKTRLDAIVGDSSLSKITSERVAHITIDTVLDALVHDLDRYCTKGTAREVFVLTETELARCSYEEVQNPHYLSAPPMRLYSLYNLLQYAVKVKYGSWKGLLNARMAREETRNKRQERKRQREEADSWFWARHAVFSRYINEEREFLEEVKSLGGHCSGSIEQKAERAAESRVLYEWLCSHEENGVQVDLSNADLPSTLKDRLKKVVADVERKKKRARAVQDEWKRLEFGDCDIISHSMHSELRKKYQLTWQYISNPRDVKIDQAVRARSLMEKYKVGSEYQALRMEGLMQQGRARWTAGDAVYQLERCHHYGVEETGLEAAHAAYLMQKYNVDSSNEAHRIDGVMEEIKCIEISFEGDWKTRYPSLWAYAQGSKEVTKETVKQRLLLCHRHGVDEAAHAAYLMQKYNVDSSSEAHRIDGVMEEMKRVEISFEGDWKTRYPSLWAYAQDPKEGAKETVKQRLLLCHHYGVEETGIEAAHTADLMQKYNVASSSEAHRIDGVMEEMKCIEISFEGDWKTRYPSLWAYAQDPKEVTKETVKQRLLFCHRHGVDEAGAEAELKRLLSHTEEILRPKQSSLYRCACGYLSGKKKMEIHILKCMKIS